MAPEVYAAYRLAERHSITAENRQRGLARRRLVHKHQSKVQKLLRRGERLEAGR